MLHFTAIGLAVALLLGMLVLLEVGYRVGRRRGRESAEEERAGAGVIDAAVFGLLALLLGFTFAGAASRLDARRQYLVQEANTIGTAYRRLDLLPADQQSPLRELFRQYTDARVKVFEAQPDMDRSEKEEREAAAIQDQIWTRAMAACRTQTDARSSMLLIPALNDMIDITTTRHIAARTHVPGLVVGLLFGVALLAAILAGHAMSAGKGRHWLHRAMFSFATALTIYVIIDLEYPRQGLIQVGMADTAMHAVRASMDER